MATRDWEVGDLFECRMYDSSREEQKMAIWRTTVVGERSHGRWLEGVLEVVEDDHLKWWLTHGPGSGCNRTFKIHICHGALRSCRAFDSKDGPAFHTDYLRMLEVRDIELRRAAWWQVGVARAEFEAFRKRLLGEARGKAHQEKPADEDVFDLEASPGDGDEFPAVAAPAGEGEGALGRQLAELKKDVAKEPKKKHKRRDGRGHDKAKARKAEAPGRERRKRSRSKSPAGGASGSLVKKGPPWFGKARSPKERASSGGVSDRSEGRGRRRRSRSPSTRSRSRRRRRRSRKEKDRGPYGIGREMAFDRGESGPSDSDSAEEGFQRGVSDRRSHQLKLVEYSLKRPGRLASRLLVKMRELLARDTGTPINLL